MTSLWTPLEMTADVPSPLEPFRSPFDEVGAAAVARRAAAVVMTTLAVGLVGDGVPWSVLDAPGGGKMFGVLVARTPEGQLGFLRAFSGTIDGRFELPGFVPPIFQREARAAVEVEGERTVKRLTAHASAFAASHAVRDARRDAEAVAARQRDELAALRSRHDLRRQRRRRQRALLQEGDTARGVLHELAQQSRADKAERRRLEEAHTAERVGVVRTLNRLTRRIAAHARLHAMVSRNLMRRIHDTYVVPNARGEVRPLRSLFAPAEPPGGAGDCAAPKLLAYAYAHQLLPVALAEFWWGAPPAGGGRVSGQFYPSCRDKCGPLLPFMLEGLDVSWPRRLPLTEDRALEDPALDPRVVLDDEGGSAPRRPR